jgi:hypothetical protein
MSKRIRPAVLLGLAITSGTTPGAGAALPPSSAVVDP